LVSIMVSIFVLEDPVARGEHSSAGEDV
jgi:hypothetical protein